MRNENPRSLQKTKKGTKEIEGALYALDANKSSIPGFKNGLKVYLVLSKRAFNCTDQTTSQCL